MLIGKTVEESCKRRRRSRRDKGEANRANCSARGARALSESEQHIGRGRRAGERERGAPLTMTPYAKIGLMQSSRDVSARQHHAPGAMAAKQI